MRLFGAAGVSFRIAEGDEFRLSVGVGQGAEQIGASLYADPAVRPTVGGRNLPGLWSVKTGKFICRTSTTSTTNSRIGLDHRLPAAPEFAP